MEPLPFDPSRMAVARAAEAAKAAGDGAPWTVSQLASRIDEAIRGGLPASVRVVGEVSGFRERTHWYFDLKDAEAVIGCAVWANHVRRIRYTPSNGQSVVATGRIEFYGKQGRATFVVDRLEPIGAGALELAFRALCEELRRLGWFDDARKRPLPAFPRRIAVVTSRSAAALQDVLDTIRRRSPWVEIALVDVRVQGEGSAGEVAAALRWLGSGHARLGIDAILVTRGGGSMEDLWAFNERVVAEAIVRSPVPVVAAIGHETDTTIAELVADVRAATPTQAAMRLTPDRSSLLEQVDSQAARLHVAASRVTRFERQRLAGFARHPFFIDPGSLIRQKREALAAAARHLRGAAEGRVTGALRPLERIGARLETHRPALLYARRHASLRQAAAGLRHAWRLFSERRRHRLAAAEGQLAAVGPESVLKRGFSVTMAADGRIVRSRADVKPGDEIRTRVLDGVIDSRVEGGAAQPLRRARSRPQPDAGPGLFG